MITVVRGFAIAMATFTAAACASYPAKIATHTLHSAVHIGEMGSERAVSFRGVTLGESQAALARAFGPSPRLIGSRHGDYWTYDRGSTLLLALVHDGMVMSVTERLKNGGRSVTRDPFGVRLGDTVTRLRAARGKPQDVLLGLLWVYTGPPNVKWLYRIEDGRVAQFGPTLGEMNLPSPATVDPPHDGTSPAGRILVVARGRSDPVRDYVERLSCDLGATWHIVKRTKFQYYGSSSERVAVECSDHMWSRAFFFETKPAR